MRSRGYPGSLIDRRNRNAQGGHMKKDQDKGRALLNEPNIATYEREELLVRLAITGPGTISD